MIDILSPALYLSLKKIKNKKIVKSFKNEIAGNEKFYNIHEGKRCFIIANGPSAKDLDFSLFRNEITFTVNQMVRTPKFKELKSNYHLWADRIFFEIDEKNSEDLEMLETIQAVNRLSPLTEVFYESMAKPMIEKYKLKETSNVNYFQVLEISNRHMERSLIDFTQPVPNYPTVVDHAILLAVYMGIKEIYLLGCDCTSIINIMMNKMQQSHNSLYAFEMTENTAKRLERYSQQRDMIEELSSQLEVFRSYQALDLYCKHNGVTLKNATNGGLLDCIERVDLKDLMLRKEEVSI